MAKYIFVVGGVMSGVGKGVAAASIGKILQSRGLRVTALKIDPYVNVDAGTMNPTEHGEVFVLNDGMECDQDMGNYERFLDMNFTQANYMTTGSVYLAVINRERSMGYGGKSVSVVPYIPMEVIDRIKKAGAKGRSDVVIVEIGGTVGEYENVLFLEAVRILKLKNPEDVAIVLVSFIPALGGGGTEFKTKPTQHAVRAVNATGIHPDIILARASVALDLKRKEKIAFCCNLREEDVISAPNVESIYEVAVNFEKDKLSERILKKLRLKPKGRDLREWRQFVATIQTVQEPVKIAIVGKYFGTGKFILEDSYISVIEALKHAAYFWKRKPVIEWLDSEDFEKNPKRLEKLSEYHGVLIPGGFGSRGVEGKILVIQYVREKKIPYFGLCYGMQLASIEIARNLAGLAEANTVEVNEKTPHPIIYANPYQQQNIQNNRYGGTMRLGSYKCRIAKKSLAYSAYGETLIRERHRHRYEFNNAYQEKLEKVGARFSGVNPETGLIEIMEYKHHPWFLGTQFHPEFLSRPHRPHPLFREFIRACLE